MLDALRGDDTEIVALADSERQEAYDIGLEVAKRVEPIVVPWRGILLVVIVDYPKEGDVRYPRLKTVGLSLRRLRHRRSECVAV